MITQSTQVFLSAYGDKSKTALLTAPAGHQLAIILARAFNRSGAPANIGIIRKFSNVTFGVYGFNGTATYTPVTVGTATQVVATVTANNGFVLQTKYRSGLIGFTVSQAGAAGVYAFKYWNGAAWVAFTPVEIPDFTTTGDKTLLFLPPAAWVVGGPAGTVSDKYSILVQATTAPGAAIQIDALWSGALIEFFEAIADNNSVSLEFDALRPFILESGESIMPYFSTANAENGMTLAYQTF